MNNILEVTSLKKSFGTKEVLKDVSFSVPEHSIFGFVGRNGAGKTTTMKLILGLMKPDGGTITVCGEPVTGADTKTNRLVGYLPDVPEFYTYMTTREYLTLCGKIAGIPKDELAGRIEELLTMVGLADEKRRIQGFSRGMRQRLGIAQSLIHKPALLICDEPTSALDPVGRKELLDVLKAAREHTSILFSSHILSDIERISDRYALLEQGVIMQNGTVADISGNQSKRRIDLIPEYAADIDRLLAAEPALTAEDGILTISNATDDDMLRLTALISELRIPVRKLERHEPTLEDLFLEVIS